MMMHMEAIGITHAVQKHRITIANIENAYVVLCYPYQNASRSFILK